MNDWNEIVRIAQAGNPPPPRRLERSADEWRAALTPEQFHVLREHGTERPFSSEMCSLFEAGRYACAACTTPLFDSSSKFESGTGWPSFGDPLEPNLVAYKLDVSFGMQRIEALCNVCDSHLGHVFPDGPPPTGLRYCINAVSLEKVKDEG